jgi:uncharacterized protein (TIGR03067 family)
MARTLAAFLLVSSAYAWAQSTQVHEDQKRLQGIWRVTNVDCPAESRVAMLRVQVAFEGDKLLFLSVPDPGVEFSCTVDPAKDPKQIDLSRTVVMGGAGQNRPVQLIFRGIYAFDENRLRLRIDQGARGRDFSAKTPAGGWYCVFTLERDTSAAGLTRVRDARAILAIRELGGEADADDTQPGPARNYVKVDESKGDALLTKIAPKIKVLSSVTGLHLRGPKVTDAGLASLQGINNIEQINLKGTAITDAGLMHLKNMTHLALLVVSDTNVTEAGVVSLKKALPQLQVTHLSRAESLSQLAITNAGGTEYFDGDGKLIEIRFARRLSDFQLLGLQKQLEVWKTTLRAVDLTNSSITDRGLVALTGLTSLRQLTLKGTDVTVAGVKSLLRAAPDLKVRH